MRKCHHPTEVSFIYQAATTIIYSGAKRNCKAGRGGGNFDGGLFARAQSVSHSDSHFFIFLKIVK
jgi:hypothetical protein